MPARVGLETRTAVKLRIAMSSSSATRAAGDMGLRPPSPAPTSPPPPPPVSSVLSKYLQNDRGFIARPGRAATPVSQGAGSAGCARQRGGPPGFQQPQSTANGGRSCDSRSGAAQGVCPRTRRQEAGRTW